MALITEVAFHAQMRKRKIRGYVIYALCLTAVTLGLLMLAALLYNVLSEGLSRLSWDFITNFPSRFPERAGIHAAIVGSIYVVSIAGVVAFSLGVGAAIYLEEYAKKGTFASFIQLNIANLAGVPSIVYGILGLEIFVRIMELGKSVIAGGLTLALLVLPIVIIASQEAIRAVPPSLKEGGFALGATKWQVVRRLVLPYAFPGILTGAILAVSRAVGETAPLIVMGALTFVPFGPDGPMSRFTVVAFKILNWVSRPQEGFHVAAAAGIIVLLVVLLTMNAFAVFLRHKFQKGTQW